MSTYIIKTGTDPKPSVTDTSTTQQSSLVVNSTPGPSTSNVEHVVTAGAAARSLAISVAALAQFGAQYVNSVEKALLDVTPDSTQGVSSNQGNYTEEDLSSIQKSMVDQASISFDVIQNTRVRNQLISQMKAFIENSCDTSLPIRSAEAQTRIINQIVPELESIKVDVARGSSTVDIFNATLLYNLPDTVLTTTKIKAIRIFRAEMDKPVFTKPLTTLSQVGVDRLLAYRGKNNQDNASAIQVRLDENGVPNSISALNYFNPFTGARESSYGYSTSYPPAQEGRTTNNTYTDPSVPLDLSHLDKSVLENLYVLSHLDNPDSGVNIFVFPQPINVGENIDTGLSLGDSQTKEVSSFVSKNMMVLESGNALKFQEIAFLTVDSLKCRKVNGRLEFRYRDQSVSYGSGYKYFVCTVDDNMIQSMRSEIVTVAIEGMRVPERPASVNTRIDQTSISLCMTGGDQLVEKFEVYRLEYDINKSISSNAITISDLSGLTVTVKNRTINKNDYLLLGESANSMRGGSEFIDNKVSPGRFYTYRVYAVDIFGNKSESPVEIDAYVPDLEQQFVYLQSPTLLVEIDALSKGMRIVFSCDDVNVESLRLERRDLTIGQTSFTTPTTPPRTYFGLSTTTHARRLLGEVLSENSDNGFTWNGHFSNLSMAGVQRVFVDRSIQFDHIYQYRLYGIDHYGNKSPYAVSSPLLSMNVPFIDSPLGLKASIRLTNAGTTIDGVDLNWVKANQDISAEQLLGSQALLNDNIVQTLYSIQRKKVNEHGWKDFPLIADTTFFDQISNDPAPTGRPPYLEQNQTYQYRVQAVQKGPVISNFTLPIDVFVGYNVAQPENFSIKTPSVCLRSFYTMLNWDTNELLGIVDYWEIEKLGINNLAAGQLNFTNKTQFEVLNYEPFRKVYRESSRFSGIVQDSLFSDTNLINQSIISGQHCYMDTQVDFGNTYFYRIRSVSKERNTSIWVYKGIKITSSLFEKKWMSILTDAEKNNLKNSLNPLVFVKGTELTARNTLSLQPNYSKANSENPEYSHNVEARRE